MAFTEKLPEWHAEGIEPPDSKKQAGWDVEDRPPAGWWNWLLNRTFKAIEELRNKAADKQYVDEAVAGVKVPDATLTQKGIVQLSNATDGTRENVAPTEKAVKAAYDRGSAGVTAAAAAQAKADAAETPAGAQAKANAAETNAKSYADQNFYNKTKIDAVNLVRNGTALFGLQDWVVRGGSWSYSENDADVGGYFYPSAPVAAGTHIFIESQPIYVFTSTNYYLGCTFHTNGGLTSDLVRVELVDASSGVVLGSVFADDNKWWHRKTAVVNMGNVDTVKIRLVATGPLTNAATVIRGFSQVSLSITSADVYHNQGDWRSLFQSVANGKTNIASAISGKGVPASGSDDFPTLANKINQISTGSRTLIQASYYDPLTTGSDPIERLLFTISPSKNYADFYPETTSYAPEGRNIALYANTAGGYEGRNLLVGLVFEDQDGVACRPLTYQSTYNVSLMFDAMYLDRSSKRVVFVNPRSSGGGNGPVSYSLPSNFNVYGTIKVKIRHDGILGFDGTKMRATIAKSYLITT